MTWMAFLAFVNKYKWWILGIIVAIILFIYIRKNWHKIQYWFNPRDINFEAGENLEITEQRKSQLEALAGRVYDDIYDTGLSGHKTQVYKDLLAVTDNELLYTSRHYKRYLSSGNTMYQDIDNENFLFVDDITEYGIDTKVMARLNKIGEGA